MPKIEKIACALWLGMGAFLAIGSLRLQIGTFSEPGPGFLPLWSGILLAGASVVHFFQLFKRGGDPESAVPFWKEVQWQRGALVVGGLVAYAFTVEYLGFLLTTFLLMFVLFSLYDRKRWALAIGGSLAVITVTYIVFCVWLKVQFPVGILGG
jgi:putative tricarboxylic transport membrane protein